MFRVLFTLAKPWKKPKLYIPPPLRYNICNVQELYESISRYLAEIDMCTTYRTLDYCVIYNILWVWWFNLCLWHSHLLVHKIRKVSFNNLEKHIVVCGIKDFHVVLFHKPSFLGRFFIRFRWIDYTRYGVGKSLQIWRALECCKSKQTVRIYRKWRGISGLLEWIRTYWSCSSAGKVEKMYIWKSYTVFNGICLKA